MPELGSVQIGMPHDVGDAASADPRDRPWRTASFKRPVAGPVTVTPAAADCPALAAGWRRHFRNALA